MTDQATRAEREEIYRHLVEDGPVAIYVHDGTVLLFANRQVARLLNAPSPADLVGMPLAKLVHPDDMATIRARIVALRDNPGFNAPWVGRIVRFDGTIVHAQVSAARCVFEGRNAIQVVLTDVSELHRAEVALREREEVLRAMLDAVEGAVTLVGVEASGRFRIQEVNPFAQRSMGKSRDELVGHALDDTFEDPRARRMLEKIEVVVRDGRSAAVEMHDDHGRAYSWAVTTFSPIKDASGVVRQILVVSMPIDERKRMEDALTASRERYRALVEGQPDAILRVRRDGRVVDAHVPSPMGFTWTEAEPHLEDVLPVEVVARLLPLIASALEEGGPQRVETVFPGAHARALEARVVRSGADEVTLVVRDTSDVHLMQQRLVAAERMASLGTLAAGVAHEINNPLSFVIGNHEAALASLLVAIEKAGEKSAVIDELEQVASALRDATEGAKRVHHTVRDLKTFSRVDDEERHVVDLKRVVSSTLHIADTTIRHRAHVVMDLADVPPVFGTESRLGQVVLNLVMNAADAIPDDAADRTVRVSLRTKDGRVHLAVQDSGTGIAPDVLPRIFEPFFTTKVVGHGTGLGLSICHGIISSLGGEIQVAAGPGQGTTFTVVLPTAGGVTPEAPAPPAPHASTRRARVLIVDDEPLLGTLMKRLLEREHDVTVTQSGEDALARLDRGDHFDVVFCDLMMPQLTGMAVHERVVRDHPEVAPRMVFMTGGAVTAAAREFLQRNDPPRIDKPFGVAELKDALRRALDAVPPERQAQPA